MHSSDLIPLINLYKEEIKNFYSLQRRYYCEKSHQKKEIMKYDINESMKTINLINQKINENLEYIKRIITLKKEIKKETEIKKKLEKKSIKINNFIEKGKKILMNNIPYFEKLPEYANKKLKTAKLSPLDLINFTLRLSQQNKAPPGGIKYFKKLVNNALVDDKQNEFSINSFYKKNKNRFLFPYPSTLELNKSILRYNFSEEKRLLPPKLIYPDPKDTNGEGYIIANNGELIRLIYPSENIMEGIKFKYSKDTNILPSMFSGEEYKDHSQPILDKDCTFKACSCKKGFKDSKIITFKFIINNDIKEKPVIKQGETEPGIDGITKGKDHIDTNSEFGFHYVKSSPFSRDSPRDSKETQNKLNRPGTSHYKQLYHNSKEHERNEDEDPI